MQTCRQVTSFIALQLTVDTSRSTHTHTHLRTMHSQISSKLITIIKCRNPPSLPASISLSYSLLTPSSITTRKRSRARISNVQDLMHTLHIRCIYLHNEKNSIFTMTIWYIIEVVDVSWSHNMIDGWIAIVVRSSYGRSKKKRKKNLFNIMQFVMLHSSRRYIQWNILISARHNN